MQAPQTVSSYLHLYPLRTVSNIMQLATFAYEPGMYEILGPWDCSLARAACLQE
jgi:hypothetical protein